MTKNSYHQPPTDFLSAADSVLAGATNSYITNNIPAVGPPAMAPITIERPTNAYIEVLVTSTAGATGIVTFNFVGKGHAKNKWPTIAQWSISVALNATTPVVYGEVINTEGYNEVALLSVVNGDGTHALSAVNANVGYKY